MKKIYLGILATLAFTYSSYAQIDAPGEQTAIGLGATSTSAAYKFTYQSKTVGHYGLGWYTDNDYPGAPTAYVSGYGGLKLFTGALPRFTILSTGSVGIGTTIPQAVLDVGKILNSGDLASVLARLPEGNTMGAGTFLGVRAYDTQPSSATPNIRDVKSFSIEHSFYGITNSAINFLRGDSGSGGGISFNTDNNSEKMRILYNGNVGIGTTTPNALLTISSTGAAGNSSSIRLDNTFSNGNNRNWMLGLNTNAYGDFSINQSNAPNGDPNLAGTTRFYINPSGNVGIGTNDPKGYKLAVAGSAIAESMTVKLQANWPDYVFKPTYQLKPLSEVKNYIDQNQHLPEIPSATEIERDGQNLGEMNKLLTKKVEELTLYLIEKDQEIKEINEKQQTQDAKDQKLQEQLKAMQKQLEVLAEKVSNK